MTADVMPSAKIVAITRAFMVVSSVIVVCVRRARVAAIITATMTCIWAWWSDLREGLTRV